MAELNVGEARIQPNRPSGVSVRDEMAGLFRRIICQWDNVTGEHLSTTARVHVIGPDGIVPIPTDDTYERGCPVLRKCLSCPNRPENQVPESL